MNPPTTATTTATAATTQARSVWARASDAALVALPGVLLLAITVGRTPGMIADSLQYYSAATTLARSGTLVLPIAFSAHEQFDALGRLVTVHPFVLWPPGYPLALAFFIRLFSLTPAASAATVNLLSLTTMLICIAALIRDEANCTPIGLHPRMDQGRATALAATTLIGVLPPVQRVFRMGLSDGLFLALCAVALVALARWVADTARRPLSPWIAGCAIAAAIHVRYLGVLLIPVHLACVWFALLRSGRLQPAGYGPPEGGHYVLPYGPPEGGHYVLPAIAPFLAGPLLGSAFLLQRWATLGCTLCAERLGSGQSLLANIRDLFRALMDSLPAVYELAPGPADTVASLAIVLAIVAVAARWRPLPRWSGASGGCRVALTFALTYVVGVVALRTAIEFNSLDARLVAPAATVLLSVGAGFAFGRMRRRAQIVTAALGVAAFSAAAIASSSAVAWRELNGEQTRALPIVEAARAPLAREPDVPLFTPDATIVQALDGIDRLVYFLPPTGVPLVPPVLPGEWAIAMVRPSDTPERRALIRALDGAGTRTIDEVGVMAWELRRRPQ